MDYFWNVMAMASTLAPPIGREEVGALINNAPQWINLGVVQGPVTDVATDLVTLLFSRQNLTLDIEQVRMMFTQTIQERKQREGGAPVPDVELGGAGNMSSLTADSREHAAAGAPRGDYAVAGDLESGSVAANPSIGSVSVASVPSDAMPSDISGLPSVVGRGKASDEMHNLAVPHAAGNPIPNEDSSEAATPGNSNHSPVRSRGEEKSGMPDGKRKRTD